MSLTEEEWTLFETYCRTLDFGASQVEEVVFRGGNTYSLEYVRKPVEDAKVLASELKENPQKYNDAGFLTILPFAKSIELHWRMLYLGTSKAAFINPNFQLSAALRSIQKSLKTGSFIDLSHEGFNKNTEVCAIDDFRNRLSLLYKEDPEETIAVCDRLIKISFRIYGQGNRFRHNDIKPWPDIDRDFRKLLKEFTKFEELFSTLHEV